MALAMVVLPTPPLPMHSTTPWPADSIWSTRLARQCPVRSISTGGLADPALTESDDHVLFDTAPTGRVITCE